MDLFRRLHQSAYLARPSPLGNSQESRDDRPRAHPSTSASSSQDSRREIDPSGPPGRYEYSSSSSSSHLQSQGASRTSQPRKDSGISPPRNQHAPHRRHASLESKQQSQAHRRNTSQPQNGQYRIGRLEYTPFKCNPFLVTCRFSLCAPCLFSFPGFRVGFGLAPGMLSHGTSSRVHSGIIWESACQCGSTTPRLSHLRTSSICTSPCNSTKHIPHAQCLMCVDLR